MSSSFVKADTPKGSKEGYRPGKVIENPVSNKKLKILAVRKNKKRTIVAYQVEELGWLEKSEAVQLAAVGRIDAVIAVSAGGNAYLRARPDGVFGNNLDALS